MNLVIIYRTDQPGAVACDRLAHEAKDGGFVRRHVKAIARQIDTLPHNFHIVRHTSIAVPIGKRETRRYD